MNKIIFLERLQNERDNFELLLNRIGFSRQLTMKGVIDGLSIKDLLADILLHEYYIVDRLAEIIHGEIYSPSTSHSAFDKFQEDFGYPDYESPLYKKEAIRNPNSEKYNHIALDDVIAEEIAVYSTIVTSLHKLTNNQYLDHDLFHRVANFTYKPYRHTSLAINKWLKRIESES